MENEKWLINANTLVKDLELLAKHEDSFRQSVILGVVHTVKKQPTVDAVEVVHGRWVVSRESEISKNIWCTACGEDFYIHKNSTLKLDRMPYCPNCGAKMDGGDEDG